MALKVTVDKPEFNLREKLTRLDTARVPYEKMPSGSVIQTQFSYYRVGGTNNEFEILQKRSFLIFGFFLGGSGGLGTAGCDSVRICRWKECFLSLCACNSVLYVC